mmetsp:Transcript_21446/g.48553  ORF Transcript_21446/g.48553 Transcript_21446/m.48553 type:complete len:305 (+) Transcript_21446:929-1843(+)
MHSSSFRSMSCTPVMFLSSTACSYLPLRCSMSFSRLLITTFSLSISWICCSTIDCFARYSDSSRLRSCRNPSRWFIALWCRAFSLANARSFAVRSLFRISTSLCNMRIFSRISARACPLLWMRPTYLLRSFFTTSYRAENSFRRLEISLQRLVRSRITSSFIRTCALLSRSFKSIRVHSLALMSLWADKTPSSLDCLLPSASHCTTVASNSSISAIVRSRSCFLSPSEPSCCSSLAMCWSTSSRYLASSFSLPLRSSNRFCSFVPASSRASSDTGMACRTVAAMILFRFSCLFSMSSSLLASSS